MKGLARHPARLVALGSTFGAVVVAASAQAPPFPMEPGQIVATCDTVGVMGPLPEPYVLGIIDTRDPGCAGAALGDKWQPLMYHNEMPNPTGDPADEWTDTNLGHIFGVALDDAVPPNIYVASTSAFADSSGTGDIFRIDGTTGAISSFATLPNDIAASPGPGLGNIAFDAEHRQFYVTDHEDGMIYRLDMLGTTLETFDPFAPDDGVGGFAPLGERLWGVGLFEGRTYFGVWVEDSGRIDFGVENTVWSVAINPATGAFVPADVTLEVTMPGLDPASPDAWSNPVSDIAFSSDGDMMLAERTMTDDVTPGAHFARTLEYVGGHLGWVPSARSFELGEPAPLTNSAGGVDYDCIEADACNTGRRVWATGDALLTGPTDWIYGVQGLPSTGGDRTDSYLIDLDGITTNSANKTSIGDVEAYRCTTCAPPTASTTASGGPCVGDTYTLDASGASCATGIPEYRWLDGAMEVCGWSGVPTCSATPSGSTTYTLEVRCSRDIACFTIVPVTVAVDPPPVPTLALPSPICLGAEITLDASGTDANGCTSGLDFQFREGATILQPWGSADRHGPLAPPATTTYTVEVRCGGCEATADTQVSVDPCQLAVTFDRYTATTSPDGVMIRWASITEEGTLGYEVRRADQRDGTFVSIGGVAAYGGGTAYELADPDASVTTRSWYRIVEVTASGAGDATPAFTIATPGGARRAIGGRSRGATRRGR